MGLSGYSLPMGTPTSSSSAQRSAWAWECLLGVAIVALLLWQYARHPVHLVDDAYIYVRYAQNILTSNGWVFNPGEPHNTATSPLWVMLLVVQGAVFGIDHLTDLSYAGSLAWMLVLVMLLYVFLRPAGRWIATATALTTVLSPHLYRTLGLPTTMHMALLFGTLLAYQRKRWNLVFVGLALLPLIRMENAILLPLIAALALRRDGVEFWFLVRRCAIASVPTAAWLLYSLSTFGRLFPVSLDAKLWQTEAGIMGAGWVYFADLANYATFMALPWARLCGMPDNIVHAGFADGLLVHPLLLVLVALSAAFVLAGVVWLVRARPLRGGGVLASWALIHTLVYGFVLNVPGYVWYFTVLILTGTWLLYAGMSRVVSRPRSAQFAAMALVVSSYGVLFVTRPEPVRARSVPYQRVATWIRENTPAHAIVIHDEPGHIACVSQRRLIDRLGLTTPQYLGKLRLGQENLCWVGSLRESAPVYFLSMSGHLPSSFVAREFADLLVYENSEGLLIRLYHLDPTRFLLPEAEDTSVFDLKYRLEGPRQLSAQTLVTVDPGRRIAPAFLLHPVDQTERGAALVIELDPDTPRYSVFRFDSAFLVDEANTGTAPADRTDGVGFTVEVTYRDGHVERYDRAHRPELGAATRARRFEFPLRPGEALRQIRLWPNDRVVLHDWWAVCQPALR